MRDFITDCERSSYWLNFCLRKMSDMQIRNLSNNRSYDKNLISHTGGLQKFTLRHLRLPPSVILVIILIGRNPGVIRSVVDRRARRRDDRCTTFINLQRISLLSSIISSHAMHDAILNIQIRNASWNAGSRFRMTSLFLKCWLDGCLADE